MANLIKRTWGNLRRSMPPSASYVPMVRFGTFAASVLLLSKTKS